MDSRIQKHVSKYGNINREWNGKLVNKATRDRIPHSHLRSGIRFRNTGNLGSNIMLVRGNVFMVFGGSDYACIVKLVITNYICTIVNSQ